MVVVLISGVVSIGVAGSATGAIAGGSVAARSASAAKPAPCKLTYTATKYGYRKYNCPFYEKTPVGSFARGKVGTLHAGTDWVLCQRVGRTSRVKGNYNRNWAYTETDQGTWGWVNAVYVKGGGNNGIFGAGIPTCDPRTKYNGKHNADYPPQSYRPTGPTIKCELFVDSLSYITPGTCRHYLRSDGVGDWHKGTDPSNGQTNFCTLETKKYDGRRICDIPSDHVPR